MATPDGRYLKDKEMAQAVAGQLAKVGITVEVEVQEFGNVVNAIGNRTSLPMALIAWKIDADPYVMLTLLHHKDGFWSMLDMPELDKLIDEQGALLDVEKRRQKMQQIQQFM